MDEIVRRRTGWIVHIRENLRTRASKHRDGCAEYDISADAGAYFGCTVTAAVQLAVFPAPSSTCTVSV